MIPKRFFGKNGTVSGNIQGSRRIQDGFQRRIRVDKTDANPNGEEGFLGRNRRKGMEHFLLFYPRNVESILLHCILYPEGGKAGKRYTIQSGLFMFFEKGI
jgi:hypothetical protein